MKEHIFGIPRLYKQVKSRCPGCQHPLVDKILCEVIKDLDIEKRTILVPGIGCSARVRFAVDVDSVMAAHGRPPDAATGIKRALRELNPIVITVQGDGDCAAIGAGSLINAAARGERITVIMLNNATYGTTGGQLAPTSLMGQNTSTTPGGRERSHGFPAHLPEMLATMKGVAYCTRSAFDTPANYQRSKKYLKKAIQIQMEGSGLGFVEFLTACPPHWHLTPLECVQWIHREMIAEFPLGEYKKPHREEGDVL